MTRDQAEAAVGQNVTVRREDPYAGATVLDSGNLLGLDGQDAVVDVAHGQRIHCPVSGVEVAGP